MFSRSVPPTHCVNGSDSIGKHVSRELIASSARRGVISVLACMMSQWRGETARRAGLESLLVLGLECLQLFVESADIHLQLIDRGVVLLHQYLLLIVCLLFLVGGELFRVLRRR